MPYSFWLTKALVRTGLARWMPSIRRRLDGGAGYLRYLSDRCLASPLDALIDLAAYRPTEAGDAIDLAGLAPRLELPPPASRVGASRGYPPPGGLLDLRAAIAEHLADGKLTVNSTDEVLVAAGATGAFAVALDTLLNPGDRVVAFAPSSPLFRIGLAHRRARLTWVPTTIESGFTRFAMEPFTRALSRAKLLVLSNPTNPTGGVFAPEDLEQIAWWANKFDVLIYCDESFARFRYEGEHVSLGSQKLASKRTLTAGSATFSCGLPAARVGWLAGYRHLVRPCAVTAALTCPFVPTAGQLAALAALRQPPAVRDVFAAKRRFVHERLTDMGLEPALPAGGLSTWLRVGSLGMTGRAFADRLYATQRVQVSPGDLYGPDGHAHVRLSFAADDGRLRAGLLRLEEFVAELRPPQFVTPPTGPCEESAPLEDSERTVTSSCA